MAQYSPQQIAAMQQQALAMQAQQAQGQQQGYGQPQQQQMQQQQQQAAYQQQMQQQQQQAAYQQQLQQQQAAAQGRQPAAPQGRQPVPPAAAAAAQPDGVGNTRHISISGCNHATVGNIVRGNFAFATENHSRPAYKKDAQVNGLDVMLYFWDDRDGANFCGWWFGPKVGGDQVWAYHPGRSQTPPKTGWKVPYDGPVDPTLVIAAAQQAAPQPSQQPQQQPQQRQGWGAPPPPQQQQQQQQQPQQQQRGGWSAPPPAPAPQQQQQKGQKGQEKGGWSNQQQERGGSWDKSGGGGSWDKKDSSQSWNQSSSSWSSGGGGKSSGRDSGSSWDSRGGGGSSWDKSSGGDKWGQASGQSSGSSWNQPSSGKGGGGEKGWGAQTQGGQTQGGQQQRQQMEESRRKLEEQNKARQEEQKKKMDEMKKQQDELRKKQEEEKKKREEELTKKRQETMSLQALRKSLGRLRIVKQEQLAEVTAEVTKVLAEEQAKCSAQAKEQMKTEVDQAIAQAKERLEKFAEQKKKEEEMKAEMERKRKEAVAKAKEHLKEIAELVEAADESSAKFAKDAEHLSTAESLDMKAAKIESTVKSLSELGEEAKEKLKGCTDFVKEKGPEVRVLDSAPKEEKPTDEEPTMPKMMAKISQSKARNDVTLKAVATFKDKATKRNAAKGVVATHHKCFDKYDKDKDGFLNQKELKAYAKGEFKFDVPADIVEAILKLLAPGAKGVKKDQLHRLKVSVGIQREKVADGKRKEARLEREKVIAALKEELQEKAAAALKEVEQGEEKVKAAEEVGAPLPKSRTLPSTEMVTLSEDVDAAVAAGREAHAEVKKTVSGLAEGVEPELKAYIMIETRKLEGKMMRWESRMAKVAGLSNKCRDDAKKKEVEELKTFEKKAIALLKYHQSVKGGSNEDLFASIAKDDKITEADFLAFFRTMEKAPAKEEETKEETKEGETKEETKEVKKEVKQEVPLSEEDLKRTFAHLDDDEEGSLSKEKFINLVRVFMKVAKDTVVTAGLSIKESKTLRRLEVGEVVELLEGPQEEESVKVMRLKVKVLKDDLEGWVTRSGNQGTLFLEEGGNVFKVVAETIMTDGFSLDGSDAKASTKKLKDTTRKLKVGELVEVREWPSKEEKSGLMRMKCRTRADGLTGWVTTVGNQGTVYLEVV